MAIFMFEASILSRGSGQSAVAAAAYNAREKIKNEQDNKTKNYTFKGGVIDKGIFLPEGAAAWMSDRAALWNGVERKENESKRWETAQLARKFIYAVPAELNKAEQIQVVKDIAGMLANRGMIADYSIHEPDKKGDQRNVHAHFMTSLRSIDERGEFGNKNRQWNDRNYLKELREEVCKITNSHLKKYNIAIDHRTLEEQGIEREPTKHKGPKITGMERRLKAMYNEWQTLNNEITPTVEKPVTQKPIIQKPQEEPEVKKKKPEPPKTKEELFVTICMRTSPYISQHLIAEMEDLQKRGDAIKKGGFDEYYNQDKKAVHETRIIFNEARETNDYEKWGKVFHALYFDPSAYPKEYMLNNFKYANARYTLWEKIRQPYIKLEKEMFPKEPAQTQTRKQEQERGGFSR